MATSPITEAMTFTPYNVAVLQADGIFLRESWSKMGREENLRSKLFGPKEAKRAKKLRILVNIPGTS